MLTCDDCPKQWDCYTPCDKVIAWQKIEGKKNRIPDKEYKAKGIAPFLSNAERIRLKSSWDNPDDNPKDTGGNEYNYDD